MMEVYLEPDMPKTIVVVISDTMLLYLSPPQLRPMTDNQKMMCGCAICNTSKYFQESLNAWWRIN